MNRRQFLQQLLIFGGIAPLAACVPKKPVFPVHIIRANAAAGHLLRTEDTRVAEGEIIETGVVIIGGGVSGLSAARHLAQAGKTRFLLLELEAETGGNARAGANETSAYPLGAHYIPTPNNNLIEYLAFLEEAGVITGYDTAGLPVYREEYLCFDPQERLHRNGRWQEGLIPASGLTAAEQNEIQRFLALMEQMRKAIGADGKEAFAIPTAASSTDAAFTRLDGLTMKAWMEQQGFTTQPLHGYVNYCCRDDFGTPHHQCSAWAGIHYFAGRKGMGSNAHHSDVITWPEGNHFLVNALRQNLQSHIRCGAVALKVWAEGKEVRVEFIDLATGKKRRVQAQKAILAVPQFVAARLLHSEERKRLVKQHFNYVPWLVANIHLKAFGRRETAQICWDNVWENSQSLGYVHASHQLLQTEHARLNFSYYYPFTNGDLPTLRREAQARTAEDWSALILEDLEKVHPGIRRQVLSITVQLWGHSMSQPRPGHFTNGIKEQLSLPVDSRIYFAHTDGAGISIFEEAFYQGLRAAQKVQEDG